MYKIVILDDEITHLFATKKYLNEHGFYAFATDCPTKALEIIKKVKPDLLIVDIIMPLKSGYEFIVELQLDPIVKTTPFIFLTAKGLIQDRIKGYKLGCNAYIAKPFNPEEFVTIIKSISNQKFYKNKEVNRIIEHIKVINRFLRKQYSNLEPELDLHLTPRESIVLFYILKGCKNKEISTYLKVSVRSIEKYVTKLLSKTKTHTRTELVAFVYFHRILVKANDGDRTRE